MIQLLQQVFKLQSRRLTLLLSSDFQRYNANRNCLLTKTAIKQPINYDFLGIFHTFTYDSYIYIIAKYQNFAKSIHTSDLQSLSSFQRLFKTLSIHKYVLDVHHITYNLLDDYGEERKDCLFIDLRAKWGRDKCSKKKNVICQTGRSFYMNAGLR